LLFENPIGVRQIGSQFPILHIKEDKFDSPVEMCVMSSSLRPAILAAATESPPPMMVVAPRFVAAAMAFAIATLPAAEAQRQKRCREAGRERKAFSSARRCRR
jgi:hypothetical protein